MLNTFLQIFSKPLSAIMEAAERLQYLINEKNQSEYDAWNNTSVLLIQASKVKA